MKKIVMTPNPYRDRYFKYAAQAEQALKEVGIETRTCLAFDVDKSFRLPENIKLHDLESELKDADLLICFGGDGTILHASKAAMRAGIPILGVNIGTMGFMAELESSEMSELRRLATGDYTVEERMMLHVEAYDRNGTLLLRDEALNDAVVTKGAVARTIQMAVSCDKTEVMSFGGDGVIVSTPTGSTGYAMSAGGPIVEATARNIIITPICAHDMQSKTVITAPSRSICVRIGAIGRKNAFLSVDGGRAIRLGAEDTVTVTASEKTTKLIHLSQKSFFDVVKNKFR